MSSLLCANQDILVGVQERGNELDGGLLQDLNVERHSFGVAFQSPYLQQNFSNLSISAEDLC